MTTEPIQSSEQTVPYVRASWGNTYHVITSIVMPIILITSAALATYFALHPALGPTISLAANFSVPLPLLICSSVGMISTIFLLSELILAKRVKKGWERSIGSMVNHSSGLRETIRTSLQPGKTLKKNSVIPLGCAQVQFQARDGTDLVGFWRKNSPPASPTVIIFHGNAMHAQDMQHFGDYYYSLGFNVLLGEYRGYHEEAGGETATENAAREAEMDAQAALAFVKAETKNPHSTKVLVHGYSLGGGYATPLAKEGVHLVLSHTFSSYADVVKSAAPVPLTKGLAWELVASAYGNGENGWNNLEKIEGMTGGLFFIRGEEDKLMSHQFGDQFIEARYGKKGDEKQTRLVTVRGGHCESHNFLLDPKAQEKFTTYLTEVGLISQTSV